MQILKFISAVCVCAAAVFHGTTASAQNLLAGSSQTQFSRTWDFISDGVMGGVSQGDVALRNENGYSFARMTGTVSTKNQGGFIQFRRKLESAPPADSSGIRLVVRGNGEPYYVHVRTQGMLVPWQYFQVSFPTSQDWMVVRLPWSSFRPSGALMRSTPKPTSITSIGIVAYGRDHTAEVEVREVSLY